MKRKSYLILDIYILFKVSIGSEQCSDDNIKIKVHTWVGAYNDVTISYTLSVVIKRCQWYIGITNGFDKIQCSCCIIIYFH